MIPNQENAKLSNELVIHTKDGKVIRVDEKYGYSDPLHFVLMHLNGEQGWEIETFQKKNTYIKKKNDQELELVNEEEPNESKYVSAMQYYAYQIQDRPGKFFKSIFNIPICLPIYKIKITLKVLNRL